MILLCRTFHVEKYSTTIHSTVFHFVLFPFLFFFYTTFHLGFSTISFHIPFNCSIRIRIYKVLVPLVYTNSPPSEIENIFKGKSFHVVVGVVVVVFVVVSAVVRKRKYKKENINFNWHTTHKYVIDKIFN